MSLLVQDFLRSSSVKDLEEKYKIDVKQHGKYSNLLLFKYNQIESPMNERIVQECRGLILDRDQDWKIISFPYTKFFNDGEALAAKIDWKTARVYEKLDGSLCTLYWYDNKWNVATSGTPDACGEVGDFGMTFEKLFWDTWEQLGYVMPDEYSASFCYMFELCTQYNRIIVQHSKPRIVLHGWRQVAYHPYDEYAPELIRCGWEIVKNYSLSSVKDVFDSLDKMNPIEQEGYVVCDAQFNRVKMKSPQYVALHHMTDGMSSRRMLELVRTNENSEFLNFFPEWTELYTEIKNKYFALLNETQLCYSEHKNIEAQKDFALTVKDFPYSGALFNMRSGKIKSFEEFFSTMQIRNLESMLGLKTKKLSAGE